MQINQSSLSAVYRGYRVIFLEALHSAAPMGMPLAMKTPSTAAEEVYHWLGAVPGMKELIGEIAINNLAASNYTIRNKEWVDTIGVKQASIERDTYGVYNAQFQAMGQAGAEHPDELLANLLIGGFTTLDYTGKNFFDTNKLHDTGHATTFSNKATAALTSASFEIGRTNIKSRLNAEGRPMNLGRKLVLVVPPALESVGRQILQADYVQGASAAITNVNKGTAELMIWPRLAAQPAYWFLLDIGSAVKPLIFQEEKPIALTSLTNPESDHVFKNHEFLYQGYGRYNAGYGLPQLAYGSNGTT